MVSKGSRRINDVLVIAFLFAFAFLSLRAIAGADRNQGCVDNAFKLAFAMKAYVTDYDERLPPVNEVNAVMPLLTPYIKGNNVASRFHCPATKGTLYQFNQAISGQTLTELGGNPAAIEIFRDAKAHPDGKLTIAFLDGSVFRGGVKQKPSIDPNDPMTTCVGHARRINISLLSYVQDYDETFPVFASDGEIQDLLFPYTKERTSFQCPETDAFYHFNAQLSGVVLASLETPALVETLRDPVLHTDKTITRGFADGHVQRMKP